MSARINVLAMASGIALNCLFALNNAALAQETHLSPERQTQIIEALSEALLEHYVLPEKAGLMANALQEARMQGDYSSGKSESAFLEQTNALLQATSKDGHLRLLGPQKFAQMMSMFHGDDAHGGHDSPEPAPATGSASTNPPAKVHGDDASGGHGTPAAAPAQGTTSANPLAVVGVSNVSEISRDGLNQTGYLALERFDGSERAQNFIARVFSSFTESDNIIIDLRNCGGGDADMVRALSNYFFAEPTHLLSATMPNENRDDQIVVERWTEPNGLSQHFASKPLAVLVSPRTFSAAESFAFGMQATGRATLVGETTGGGGYMNDFFPLLHDFGASISVGRTYDPRTGNDWQSVGVKPGVQVEQDHALFTALTNFTRDSGKLDELQGDELRVYEQLQAYTNAWYGADPETMNGLLSDEFVAVNENVNDATVERISGNQLVADTASGKGQKDNRIYYNRIIRDIDIAGEQSSAQLILRETIHHMLLQKIDGDWLITRDDFAPKRRSRL